LPYDRSLLTLTRRPQVCKWIGRSVLLDDQASFDTSAYFSEALAAVLRDKAVRKGGGGGLDLTIPELEELSLPDLSAGSYIKVDSKYFRPAESLLLEDSGCAQGRVCRVEQTPEDGDGGRGGASGEEEQTTGLGDVSVRAWLVGEADAFRMDVVGAEGGTGFCQDLRYYTPVFAPYREGNLVTVLAVDPATA